MPEGSSSASGITQAMAFLRRVREDETLADPAAQVVPDDGLEPVMELAARAGFVFSAEDLRRAYVMDWHLRRARYA